MFSTIPHASFPFDESPWIPHFYDAAEANKLAQLHAAGAADEAGHDSLARHIMAAGPGENPFASYFGPMFEGRQGRQFVPRVPNRTMTQYFGGYTPPGGLPGAGPFADPLKSAEPGSAGGRAVAGSDPSVMPPGSAY